MAKKRRTNRVKKTRLSIPIEDKLFILTEYESGTSKHEISRMFRIPRPTVIEIIDNGDKILEAWSKDVPIDKKRLRTAKYPDLEDMLFEWIERKRDQQKAILSQITVKVSLLFSLLFWLGVERHGMVRNGTARHYGKIFSENFFSKFLFVEIY